MAIHRLVKKVVDSKTGEETGEVESDVPDYLATHAWKIAVREKCSD
jgi:hypothetical protein